MMYRDSQLCVFSRAVQLLDIFYTDTFTWIVTDIRQTTLDIQWLKSQTVHSSLRPLSAVMDNEVFLDPIVFVHLVEPYRVAQLK